MPGEHWIAMYFDGNGKGEYFGSYGLSPQLHRFTDLMHRNSKRWIYNRKTLQVLFSAVCGHYCVYYILFRSRGFPMHAIISHFLSNLTQNDQKVARFIRNL